MNEHPRRIPEAELPAEERHQDGFLPGDPVYIDPRADHKYRGHCGIFHSYAKPDIGDTQRWARLAIGEALVSVSADSLSFAPESEVYVDDQAPAQEPLDFERLEHLRTWEYDGFRLELFDTGTVDRYGKARLAYEFFDDEFGQEPVVAGAEFHCSPLDAIDSDATVAALLGFLSLRPGDTDAEYFESYSQEQLEWCQRRGEALGTLGFELECQD